MQSSKKFFNWAFNTRAENVIKLQKGEMTSPEKMFLSFCSHEPAFVSYGPAGLNASVKGVGFLPKDEYLEETLEIYLKHIATYEPDYQVNPEACLIFHQPPMISYKLKGKVEIYDENLSGKRELYQQFINAQHDVYHNPTGMKRWKEQPAYIFRIEEVYDNSATKDGFGERLEYPYVEE